MPAKDVKRMYYLMVRVTEYEKDLIRQRADEKGLSVSSYIRMMVLGGKKQ